MTKYKLIALMGPSGSGKDTILNVLTDIHSDHFNKIINCTTRPPREGEKNGFDYYFLSEEDFLKKVSSGDMLEYTTFNGWRYGTERAALSLDKINVGVYNPKGIRTLMKKEDIELYVRYIVVPDDKTRLLRLLNREAYPNVSEIIRRFIADEKDFQDISDIDYKILINARIEDVFHNVDFIFNRFC